MSKAWMVDAKEFEADQEIVRLISLHKQVRGSAAQPLTPLRTNREDYTAVEPYLHIHLASMPFKRPRVCITYRSCRSSTRRCCAVAPATSPLALKGHADNRLVRSTRFPSYRRSRSFARVWLRREAARLA